MAVTDRDNGMQRLLAEVRQLEASLPDVTVGIHGAEGGSAPYPDGESIADIAETHEFGLGVPQRSFIRAWFDEVGEARFVKAISAEVEAALAARTSALAAMRRVALTFQADIQDRISAGIDPPNAPSTIARKGGFDTPLVHRGHLKAAVIAKVGGTKVG